MYHVCPETYSRNLGFYFCLYNNDEVYEVFEFGTDTVSIFTYRIFLYE